MVSALNGTSIPNSFTTEEIRFSIKLGYEKDRHTLKYRCPARHEGWVCPSEQRCNEGKAYGLVIRVKSDLDLRRFPPIPRATQQFEKRYKGRTAVERVNGRLKVFWGADDGNLTGARRFHSYVGVVLVVCLGLTTLRASTPRREGSMGQTRLNPIALALRELAVDGAVPGGENESGPNEVTEPPEAGGAEQPDTS